MGTYGFQRLPWPRAFALPLLAIVLLTLCCNDEDSDPATAARTNAPAASAREDSAASTPAAAENGAAGGATSGTASPATGSATTSAAPVVAGETQLPSTRPRVVHSPPSSKLPLNNIRLPAGFRIGMFAENVSNARSLALGDEGTVFVGNRNEGGSVFALQDQDGDGAAEKRYTIASGLFMPNGVAFMNGALYVAEVNKVWKYDGIVAHLDNPGRPELIRGDFPSDTHHGWKYIAFGPDGLLYVPVGAPCNVCEEDDPYASIMRMQPDGQGLTMVARGIRNTVGFAWHPVTGELWFTDNGRDMLGDDIPPDELNRIPADSQSGARAPHFGFPYWHGKSVVDPEFGAGHSAGEFELPERELGAHVAALGMKFYSGDMFPAEYGAQIFLAEHGSWNRSKKIGYRVMLVTLDERGHAASYDAFAAGWKQGEEVWGRPVDILVLPDGSLLVSDDYANCVYRITYEETN